MISQKGFNSNQLKKIRPIKNSKDYRLKISYLTVIDFNVFYLKTI